MMVVKDVLKRRIGLPSAAFTAGAAIALLPWTAAYAEASDDNRIPTKKSIYDEPPSILSKPPTTDSSDTQSMPKRPTPTDRLAVQIGKARLSTYKYSLAAEKRFDDYMTRALALESSFTHTIQSLAPPPQSNEKLLPGAIYVVVAAMTGSIITRNRNILLRFSIPLAVGIGAGWVVLPTTMRNIADLTWKYEERYPSIRDTHLQVRGYAEHGWDMASMHAGLAGQKVESGISDVRQRIENWVSGKHQ